MRAKPVRKGELTHYEDPITRALARYLNSSAVKAALLVAAELINYRPRRDYSWELRAQTQMTRLRDAGVTPRELLTRMCAVWALQADRQRFADGKELRFALAREVFKLRKSGTWRPVGKLLDRFGYLLLDELGTFMAGLWQKVQQDAEVRAKAKQAFSTGWQLDGE